MNNLMRGHLRVVILSALEEKQMSGSEIIAKINSDFGWKPSCGSVYPILNILEKENLTKALSNNCVGRKKIYSLTSKGKIELKNKKLKKKELTDEVVKIHEMMASLYNIDKRKMDTMVDTINKGKIPFAQIHEEVEDLKYQMYRILSENLIADNQEELRNILIEAITKLKKIKSKSSKSS